MKAALYSFVAEAATVKLQIDHYRKSSVIYKISETIMNEISERLQKQFIKWTDEALGLSDLYNLIYNYSILQQKIDFFESMIYFESIA